MPLAGIRSPASFEYVPVDAQSGEVSQNFCRYALEPPLQRMGPCAAQP